MGAITPHASLKDIYRRDTAFRGMALAAGAMKYHFAVNTTKIGGASHRHFPASRLSPHYHAMLVSRRFLAPRRMGGPRTQPLDDVISRAISRYWRHIDNSH